MSSVHCVVVWEYQKDGQWLPHTPGVARTLERAHAKKLTRVVLADADPALKGHYVNLRTLTQCLDTPEGGTVECLVRRQCYSVQSAGGRGARWEWARLSSPPLPAELHYEPMPMEVQCLLEAAWRGGARSGVSWRGWSLQAARGTARRGAALRLLRRAHQPPYPLTRSAPLEPPPPPQVPGRQPRIPQQHTGSSVQSVQSVQSVHSVQSVQSVHSVQSVQSEQSRHTNRSPPRRGGARSASPTRDRKPGLARQILHNLNIFSNNSKQSALNSAAAPGSTAGLEEQRSEAERAARRHSVDTVSTYLSHESKDSLQRGSVGELLDCSGGSDDVFEPSQEEPSDGDGTNDEEMVDAEGALPLFVRLVRCPQWGALCGRCVRPLGGPAPAAPAVALRACHHMLHLHCLRGLLREQDSVYIECLVCGRVYGTAPPAPAPPLPAPPAPPGGAQPPGSMAWRLQPGGLPQLDCCAAILVTYNFQSGVQGPEQPAPGAPYYAVGFPRHSLLPDCELGRQVLSALRLAWERRALFTVCASQTTGREHVVAWRVPPPPAERAHYAPPAHPARLLHAALARLHALLP